MTKTGKRILSSAKQDLMIRKASGAKCRLKKSEGDAVRDKLASLGLTEGDAADAVSWARLSRNIEQGKVN
ncbi:MAG: general stress protein [Rhodospirillales bacterium]|nr:general stress protein [Rhodospirillales bacterium]